MLVNYFGATCRVFSLCVLLLVVGTGAYDGDCVCRDNFTSRFRKPQSAVLQVFWRLSHYAFCKVPLVNDCEDGCYCTCPLDGFNTDGVDGNGNSIIVCTDGSGGEEACLEPGACDPDSGDPGDSGESGDSGDPGDSGESGDSGDPGDSGDDSMCPGEELCCPGGRGCGLPLPNSDTPVCHLLPCATDDDCFVLGEICCEKKKVCEMPVPGSDPQVCDDPHMTGLRGQKIDWSGVDGGWYCLVRDDGINLQVNLRLTAPLADDFPDRQLITGLSVLSEGHSLVVEVDDPYSVDTDGCLDGISPCLSNGGLLVVTDGQESKHLLHPTRDEYVGGGMHVSASNLPVECRLFGGSTVWAQMYEEMMQGHRQLSGGSFEDWVMTFDHVAAPEWCMKYIKERGLTDVQSAYALFRVSTPTAHVQLHVGIDHQGGDQLDWDGRALPDLDFWQMDAGVHGLSLDSETLTGILGETARPVLDEHGHEIMEGSDAMRGTVEDYRVSGALGTEFALLHKKQAA